MKEDFEYNVNKNNYLEILSVVVWPCCAAILLGNEGCLLLRHYLIREDPKLSKGRIL